MVFASLPELTVSGTALLGLSDVSILSIIGILILSNDVIDPDALAFAFCFAFAFACLTDNGLVVLLARGVYVSSSVAIL